MKNFNLKMAGAIVSTGLLAGALGVGMLPAGGAVVNLLPTTTSVGVTPSPDYTGTTPTITAIVNLELVKGALVTPAGDVVFTVVDGATTTAVGSAPVASCLLGLPSILHLYSATCSASLTTSAIECLSGTLTATYSGSKDLIAKGSVGTTEIEDDC